VHHDLVLGVRLIEPHTQHLDVREEEVEALLIDDPPILSGTKLDQKGMDEQTIFSIEIEPETAADVNKRLVVLGAIQH
jgi:hypothetical protein